MNLFSVAIGVTLRVLFELFAIAVSIVWFATCSVVGLIGFVIVFCWSLFTSKPNVPS